MLLIDNQLIKSQGKGSNFLFERNFNLRFGPFIVIKGLLCCALAQSHSVCQLNFVVPLLTSQKELSDRKVKGKRTS